MAKKPFYILFADWSAANQRYGAGSLQAGRAALAFGPVAARLPNDQGQLFAAQCRKQLSAIADEHEGCPHRWLACWEKIWDQEFNS